MIQAEHGTCEHKNVMPSSPGQVVHKKNIIQKMARVVSRKQTDNVTLNLELCFWQVSLYMNCSNEIKSTPQ